MNPPEEAPTTELPPEAADDPLAQGESPVLEDLPPIEDVPEEAFEKEAEVAREPKEEPPVDKGPQTFKERALATLFMPAYAFRHHSARWGWAKPWLLVSALGMLIGAFTLTQVDLAAVLKEQDELVMDMMGPQMRARMETAEAQEGAEAGTRLKVFIERVKQVGGPPVSGLVGILFFGGVVFVLSRLLRGPQTPLDLMRCLSLVSFVYLVDILVYLAKGVAVSFGSTMLVLTSPAAWVDPFSSPVIHTVLSRLDPLLFFFYGLLAVGMIHSLRISRRRAICAVVGIWGGFSVLLVAFATLGAFVMKKIGGAG